MDVKNSVVFSIVKNGRTYAFNAPVDGNLGEAYDAAYNVLDEIVRRIQDSVQKAAPKSPAEDAEGN